jgi:hypothetical protein
MPLIDPTIEQPTREMLRHAFDGELDELAILIQSVGADQYRRVLGMCLATAAYIAVDVSDGRWPTDDEVREIARHVEEHEAELPLDRADVYEYLEDAALGFRPLPQALNGDVTDAALPVLITASMLFTFRPQDQGWETYLDQIWSAYEIAQNVELAVLPALQVRTHMHKAFSAQNT